MALSAMVLQRTFLSPKFNNSEPGKGHSEFHTRAPEHPNTKHYEL